MDTKVYLRHVKSRLYYSGWQNWTPDPQQALDFQNTDNAFQKAKEQQLSQVEVVIFDGDSATEKILRIVEPGV